METTTSIDSNDATIDSILAMVDVPQAAPELPLDMRMRLEETKRRAYHRARSEGKTSEEANVAAQAAYNLECELILRDTAPVPIQAPPKDPPPTPPIKWVPVTPSRPVTPSMPNIEAGQVDSVGAARSRRDADALLAAGFSPSDPVYERGSRVNETGVANARRSRIDHEQKPLVIDATTDLIARIRAERRRDVVVNAGNIGMSDDGRIVVTGGKVGGADIDDVAVAVNRSAFKSLVNRLGYAGADYLARLPIKARAANVNMWRSVISGSDPELAAEAQQIAAALGRSAVGDAEECKLRLRTKRDGTEEAFAVVSPSYTSFDADLIADAVRRTCMTTPTMSTSLDGETFQADLSQARGRLTYDGTKTRMEVMFHSDIRPEVYVAGEFFKAGVLIRTDDTGGGSCKVVPVVWQNRCLNLIILEAVKGEEISILHLGDIASRTKKFEAAFQKSLRSIAHFLKAWGNACRENVLEATGRAFANVPSSVDAALPGLFNGILEQKLVAIPGKRREVVNALVEQWRADDSGAKVHGLTRASLVNAFTRYAHTIQMDDPWAEDEIERDAGRLLFGRGQGTPGPVPFVSLEEVAEATSAMARAN